MDGQGVREGDALIAVLASSDRRRSGDGRGSAQGSLRQRSPGAFAELCGRLRCRSVAALCVLLGASLLGSAPALAASQRGHVFSFAFGVLGEGSGQFFHPSGVAVNSSTGDVYVADRENDRVEEFEPVLNKEGELVNEKYVKGFSVPFPEGVAVDSSKGGPSEGDG